MSAHFGVAFDIGTTNLEAALVSLPDGRELARRQLPNPQVDYGSDILSRIDAARNVDTARRLHSLLIHSLCHLLAELVGEPASSAPSPRIGVLVAVGNPAMYTFLRGIPAEGLLRPPYDLGINEDIAVPAHYLLACGVDEDVSHAMEATEPRALFHLPGPIASFCGSDALALILATGIDRGSRVELAIDIGTNGEIALSDGKTIRIASVASGPAFEGGHLSCGMPAVEGAVYRVDRREGVLGYELIGDGEPRGVCGSGVIDLVAELLRAGDLDANGMFVGKKSYPIARGVELTQEDVSAVQLAKAAFAGGIYTLLEKARRDASEIERVWVSGRFGAYLNPENARAIGLIPPEVDAARVELIGNGALEGAKLMLSEESRERVPGLRRRLKHMPLSGSTVFNRSFVANMRFPL